MKPIVTLGAVAAVLAGCATVDGYYDFTHPTNTVEQKNQDFDLCTTSWLNSPLIAEYTRQIQAGAKEDEEAGGYGYRARAAKNRRERAGLQHITACMGAIGYMRLWYDEHSPRGRLNREVPRI